MSTKSENSVTTNSATCPQAYILRSSVTHGRYLPVESQHAFTYPALFMFVSLHALESGQLSKGFGTSDGAWGWAFGYGKPKRRLVSIEPHGYLSSGREGDGTTITERLQDVFKRDRGPSDVEKKKVVVHDAWMLTMPSFVGWVGINPLTVYFVYSHEDGVQESVFTSVVLEIHNTFGESHAHVLKVGEGEDTEEERGRGYDHQWTFARQFHVSPFNDRSGFYTVGVKSPTHAPSGTASFDDVEPPKPTVRVQLYTAQPSEGSPEQPASSRPTDLRGELKLSAILRPTAATPLTGPGPLLRALMKMPFDLLMTTARINYQAWVLHYGKPRLDVYMRPEMKWPSFWSKNISEEAEVGTSGSGIKWNEEGLFEKYARWRVERFLDKWVDEVGVQVTLVPANPAMKAKTWVPELMQTIELGHDTEGHERHLKIGYLSSKLFTTLLLSPSAEHALLVGVDTEGWFQVSSRHLFINVFTQGVDGRVSSADAGRRSVLQRLRTQPIRTEPSTESGPGSKKKTHIPIPVPSHHFLDRSATKDWEFTVFGILDYLWILNVLNYAFISMQFALDGLEKAVFSWVKARVVKGQEPWLVWERAAGVYWGEKRPEVDKERIGSVRQA